MGMEISRNNLSYYQGIQTNSQNIKGNELVAEETSTRKTAADELSYLQSKYDGIQFFAMDVSYGTTYGSKDTTNIAISPTFLKKMADNPELEKEYTDQFENMKRLDKENIQRIEAGGGKLIAQGWVIDKDGGMSKWSIGTYGGKQNYKQQPYDYLSKLRKQKAAKKKSLSKNNNHSTAKAKIKIKSHSIDARV